MTQYILHISSYAGLVGGAKHFRGRVEGPYAESCHGGSRYNAPGARGKTICEEGHEIPSGRVSWEVEAVWSDEHYKRYADNHFEGDGPGQFLSAKDVMDTAIVRFLDGADKWYEQEVEPAQEGDELWYGWVNPEGGQLDDLQDPEDGWGMMIARKCTT